MSNAGVGLSPNKQAATGKVSATSERGPVSPNYIKRGDDGRDRVRGGMPAGSLSAKATGMPQNTLVDPSCGFFATDQPKAPVRALGTAAASHGTRGNETADMMRGKGNKYTPPRWG